MNLCRSTSCLTLAALLTLAGCKPDPALQKAEVIGRGTKVQQGPRLNDPGTPAPDSTQPAAPTGSVVGTILFSGKPPAPRLIDTSMDPACSLGGTPPAYTQQFAVTAGKLANVFIYVKSGPASAMQAPATSNQPVVLDQKGCLYSPHVIGVMAGGVVEFRNSDPTMHNIHTMPNAGGNQTIDVSQGPRGNPQIKQFNTPELMLPVRCNNHPWMNAYINVSATPFFAVTDATGHFALRGLPPGDYILGAIHEKLGEKTFNFTVTPNSTTTANLSFSN